MVKVCFSIFVLCSLALSKLAMAAGELPGGWVGGMYGYQQTTAGSTIKPKTYGITAGLKIDSVGIGLSVFTGNVKSYLSSVEIVKSATFVVGSLPYFPLGLNYAYIGPAIAYANLSVSAATSTASAKFEGAGLLVGGVGGINIPIGFLTVGAEGVYPNPQIES